MEQKQRVDKKQRFHVVVVKTDPILQVDTWTLQVTASFKRLRVL